MKKSVISSLVASTLLCSSLALAHAGGTGKFMKFFDTNKDGMVTLEEFETSMKTRFDRMDANHDGRVSREEFYQYLKQRRKEHRQARLKMMDSNGDGQVSKDEFLAYANTKAAQRFARMDRNQDGILSADELGMRTCHHHRHTGRKGLFSKIDANHDGVVTLEESRAAWSAWFKRLDSNGDNVVTSDEVKAFREHRRATKAAQ